LAARRENDRTVSRAWDTIKRADEAEDLSEPYLAAIRKFASFRPRDETQRSRASLCGSPRLFRSSARKTASEWSEDPMGLAPARLVRTFTAASTTPRAAARRGTVPAASSAGRWTMTEREGQCKRRTLVLTLRYSVQRPSGVAGAVVAVVRLPES
jgi:hypothetical protein